MRGLFLEIGRALGGTAQEKGQTEVDKFGEHMLLAHLVPQYSPALNSGIPGLSGLVDLAPPAPIYTHCRCLGMEHLVEKFGAVYTYVDSP